MVSEFCDNPSQNLLLTHTHRYHGLLFPDGVLVYKNDRHHRLCSRQCGFALLILLKMSGIILNDKTQIKGNSTEQLEDRAATQMLPWNNGQ